MGILLLNSNKSIEALSLDLKKILEFPNMNENDSVNAFQGIYFSFKLMGLRIKLEYNSYDYEDLYNYVLIIGDNALSKSKMPKELMAPFTEITGKFLACNMKQIIANEINDELIVYDEWNEK